MLNLEIIATIQSLKSQIAKETPDNPVLSGWAAYSQCDEDGIIQECLNRIAAKVSLTHSFVEIGCADGLENNTHLLLLNGSRGVWIDGSSEKISSIESGLEGAVFEKLWVSEEVVTLESAKLIAERASRFLGVGSIDFLSLDIDGNDWHVLPLFVAGLNPKLVGVEYNAKFPPPLHLVMDYNGNHIWAGDDYFGASLQAWTDLMEKQGYSLVCCNLSGANAFFVRKDLSSSFAAYTPTQLYQPPRYFLVDAPKGHRPSLRWLKQILHTADASETFRFVMARGSETSPFRFAVHSGADEFISGDIVRDGVWEPFETRVFTRLCRPGDTVLDLGANIGWYSVLAAKILGIAGHVLAFEPDEANARLLEINAAVAAPQGIIQIIRSAVGDREEEALLFRSDSNRGDHRLFSDGSSREKFPVQVTTLDTFFADRQQLPDIVKSDTQGSEMKILEGAKGLFANGWRPIMILEFWPFGLTQSGDDPVSLWRKLIQLGYACFEVSELNPMLVPVSEERLTARLAGDISPASQGFINLLCLPESSTRIDRLLDLFQNSPQLSRP
jgi:FkbM family methyltransferase